MATNRPQTALDAVLGRSLADTNWITGAAIQDALSSLAFDRMADMQRVVAGFDFDALFPSIRRINAMLATLPGSEVFSPALLQFADITRHLNRTLLPVLPELTFIGELVGGSQRRLLETVGASLRPLSLGLNVLSPDLLDSLRLLSEQLATVQDDPVAAEAALDRAARATPSLRPLIDWMRENQGLAGWAAVVLMLIFFITEQVQRDPGTVLQVPAGSVLLVPPAGGSDTGTVQINPDR